MEKKVVAMLLAGGRGTRLKKLTEGIAKPAVYFGGKYRIIDFALSNCANSGIDTIGVLTQYEPLVLNAYIGNGAPWDLDINNGGIFVLPPYVDTQGDTRWYSGTADAIYHNTGFIDQYNPEYVLILSGDHIYKMDYYKFIDYHNEHNADITIAVKEVSWDEAHRFGVMKADEENRIIGFQEKPENPESNLASMGVYLFKWDLLKEYLLRDNKIENSQHDFGKNIIPMMADDGRNLYAYRFSGYWKDVGTVKSFWDANMDLLHNQSELKLDDTSWHIYTRNPNMPPQFISPEAAVRVTLISEGCVIEGDVEHSILYYGVEIGKGTEIKNSVILPWSKIGKNVFIKNAVIGEKTIINDNVTITPSDDQDVILVGNEEVISRERGTNNG
ncbi:MAG: glucose-1-phosphate adenylyltransferase [Halanaerobiaceae bacterium]